VLKISHRGNLKGPNPQWENSPAYLTHAISKGYDVEIDVWVTDGLIHFGHDMPTWRNISRDFIEDIAPRAWFHCKNLEALHFFSVNYPGFSYFWHQTDQYTLTSNGYIWTYPGNPTTERSIAVCLSEKHPVGTYYGICSDYFDD
jgi:hypothetical protein